MKWKGLAIWLLLLLAWAGLGIWQWSEYNHLRTLAFDELHRQAETVNRALVAGIQTHRRTGRFFAENLQVALNELVKSEIVVAVAVSAEDGKQLAFVGEEVLLGVDAEGYRNASVFPYRSQFELQPFEGDMHGGPGSGGRRWGGGRGANWLENDEPAVSESYSDGGLFTTLLVLDSTSTEARCRREAWLRGSVVAAGWLVLSFVALAWRASVRTAQAQGRAKLFESETRQLRDLNQAAAGLAHETRNPLGLIRGWTQRLAQSCDDRPELRAQALAIVEECDRVTSRINEFLAFARPLEPRIETVLVSDLLNELAALLEPDLDTKTLDLDHHTVPLDETFDADREMLRQILFNLLQNAVQFSPEEGTVEVRIRPSHAGHKRIEVSDRGPGVPDESVESLFMPYFTSRPDGTGLGLAIVRRIAMAHGWRTGYSPRVDGGSIFWLDQIDG